jgi:primosomal protein N' (replication factor Y)
LFYENLAYFISARPVKKESYLKLDLPELQFDHDQSELISKYFGDSLLEIPERKILKEDHMIIEKMVAQGYIKRKTTILMPKKTHERCYVLRKIPESFKPGKTQAAILKLLEYKSMKSSELKQLIPSYRQSLSGLIEKGLVQEEIVDDSQISKNNQQIKSLKNVLLSVDEEKIFQNFTKMEGKACFFKNNNSVSKFRVLFKIIQEKLMHNKSVLLLFPEINLSYQKYELFYKYFGDVVGMFHHKVTSKEQGRNKVGARCTGSIVFTF